MSQYTNSEQEKIGVELCRKAPFAGKPVLIIYDDPPSPRTAPMLFDKGVAEFLLGQIAEHWPEVIASYVQK